MNNQVIPDLGLKNIPSVIEENTLKHGHEFPYNGIWLFSGSQGNGKTLLMMHCVAEMLKEYPDAILVSNISIFGLPCIPYKGLSDFEKYNNGQKGIIFIIDEIHTLFSSLESAKMPVSTLTVWSQNRKNRRVILGTSQRFTRVAKGLREQAIWNYECKRLIPGLLYSYRILDASEYDDNGQFIGEQTKFGFYIPNVHVMRMYSTHEVVKREDFT